MSSDQTFDIFLVASPGLESVLCDEAHERGFAAPRAVPGGVETRGDWPEVWRANLELRGAGRVLVRIGTFRAFHLAQLDKRSRKFPWGDVLRSDVPVRVEVTCRRSKIYHAGAAAERIERAIREELGTIISAQAVVCLKVRIDDDLVTLSVDSSGEGLHKRGHKLATGKAPMRETLAALFLRQCGFDGSEPVIDPMCGSGTFVIEAAEIAAGLMPGRSREFAFEHLAGFDAAAWQTMRAQAGEAREFSGGPQFHGSDRDAGAVEMARANAGRAGVAASTVFRTCAIGDATPPDGTPGLVIVNPPYGARIGNKKLLYALHGGFGKVMKERFRGWRIAMVTSEAGLARATGLPFGPPGPPVAHGGLKVRLFQAGPI
ncbi:putative N6-adenine-specific DNA methylase [Salinihabitans flavidus]|uniref:Putative N6-adenine-specific DNA methylase n=1 Tax=Salinihabitans flavidus TaxID=569882 RepID=A0A1H8UM67_9RHOB|nr:RNA methyltransferase [Salinihabitans flavidus]SEP04176.1 putative N6-adenine-specific DNA methylase [Salinihabitans flavidus]